MKPSEVLRGAIREIRKRGWHKGALFDKKTGGCCAAGAMRLAAHCDATGIVRPKYRSAFERAYEAMGNYLHGSVWLWNDDPNRTRRQVLTRLAAVARKLEAQGK